MQFRNDINGLRAVAVIPVLLFHAQWALFSGGFLGVDVFFVISGFLITSLILNDLKAQSFSLASFYNRRARRILPALFFTCIITSILAFFFMLPYDLKNYGQSLFATVLSANNILLFLTSGYWSLAAEFKPLYHTWSLAVEEQYYLLIPVILMLVFRAFKKSPQIIFLFIVAILFIASFYLSFTSTNKEFNFLIISHRMWELLAGSACALLIPHIKKTNNPLALIGISAIIASYIFPYFLSHNQAVYTSIPVIGTALVILFSSNDTPLGKTLSVKPIAIIGSISYSIYLLHMPLLAFLRLSTQGPTSVVIELIVVLLSLPLAYLSWRFIERNFKDRSVINNRLFYGLHVSIAIALIFIGYNLHKTYGLEKLKAEYQNTVSQQVYTNAPRRLITSSFTNQKLKNLLVIGDSYARDVINMLAENDIKNQYEVIYQPSLNASLQNNLLRNADITLIVSSQGLSNTINAPSLRASSLNLRNILKQHEHTNVYLIGTKNFGYNNNFIRIKSFFENKNLINNYRVSPNKAPLLANEIERSVWQERYIDVFSPLLDSQNKVRMFTDKGRLISYDTNHLTPEGAKYIGNLVLNQTQLGAILNINTPQ